MQTKHSRIHTWLRLLLLAPGLAVLSSLILVIPTFAATVTTIKEPFNFSAINPCNGELVTLQGELDAVFLTTPNGRGGYHVGEHTHIQAMGIGDQGNQYWINETYGGQFNVQVEFEQSYVTNYHVISAGSAPNYLLHDNLLLKANADGTVTLLHETYSTQCQG